MKVRDYNPATDRDVVEQIHRDMGMDYKLPDLDSPLFIVRKVFTLHEQIVACSFLKLQAESYLMLSCDLDTLDKTRAIAHLNHETEREAHEKGLDTLVAYIPEAISKKFAKRLTLLGWEPARAGWLTWIRELL